VNIPIVYEDEWLLVADKPAGLLTIPTPKNEARTLTSILNDDLKLKGAAYRLHPCHRLDRSTSGLIIYAKGKSMQKKMMELFKARAVKKTYIAFLHGLPRAERGTVNSPIEAEDAVTHYKVIEKRKDFSIVEVNPLTGRKNQIRIHFRRMGHPLVGEDKFAFRKDYLLKAKRPFLHAKSLEFIHPQTGEPLVIDSGLAGDMEEFLQKHAS
jgi:RluA family pseudouridine synthase